MTAKGGKRTPNQLWLDHGVAEGWHGKPLKRSVVTHEGAHAAPKRSSWRMAQIVSKPKKHGAEEARADFIAGDKYYKKKSAGTGYVQRVLADPKSSWSRGYMSTQDKMRAAQKRSRP